MTYGIIPDEIAIVSSVEQPIYRRWEDMDEGENTPEPEREMVVPAFVCEANNPKTLATAVGCAENSRNYWDLELKQSVKKADPVVKDVQPNLPMKDLRVVQLDIRGNGGRAYKVVTKENYYFDVREDVLLDTMIKVGIRPGGILNGEFIWARVSSSMKIVRIGSALHNKLIQSTEKSKMKKVNARNLVPGTIYSNKREEKHFYLGRVNAVSFNYHQNYQSSRYGYSGTPSVPKYFIYKRELKNAHVWVSCSSYDKTPLADIFNKNKKTYYYVTVSSSHSFIEEHGTFTSDPKKELEDMRRHFEKENGNKTDEASICRNSVLRTITPSDETFHLAKEFLGLTVTPRPTKEKAA